MEEIPANDGQQRNDELSALIDTTKDLSAQEVIGTCLYDKAVNVLCTKYEKEIWTYLLQAHYPSWGVTDTPKEYYIRIAEINGIRLRDTSQYAGKVGQELLDQQERRPYLMMKVGDMDPFPIPDILGKAYSTALETIINRNIENRDVDPEHWILKVQIDDLNVKTQQAQVQLTNYFKAILNENREASIDPDFELDAIAISNLLQCKDLLCDSLIFLIEARMTRLEQAIKENNDIFQEEVDYLKLEFALAPGFVAFYLKAMSDLLYRTDNFNEDIILYYREILKNIPNIAVALMPHGYPFTKRENIDRFNTDLFIVNPLKQPLVSPDYLSANVCAKLGRRHPDDPEEEKKLRVWRAGAPYPIITAIPDEATLQQRLAKAFPPSFIFAELAQIMRKNFPDMEAGFILAGGLPSMIFDNWVDHPDSHWLLKTDADLFVYGKDLESRIKAFNLIFDVLVKNFVKDNYRFSVWQSVLTVSKKIRLDKNYNEVPQDAPIADPDNPKIHLRRYVREIAIQVVNTNSLSGFEVIMNFDTSHIQIGWDCHRGWIATPYWELYYPRRESLLVRYNIRAPRLVKTLYKGFTLKTLMPYSLVLTPKGISYSQVLRNDTVLEILPELDRSYADDLELIGNLVRMDHVRGVVNHPDVVGPVEAHYKSNPQQDNTKVLTRSEGQIKYMTIQGDSKLGVLEEPDGYPEISLQNIVKLKTFIKFNGQFKNGFDAYVREKYLTYDLNNIDLNKVSLMKLGEEQVIDVEDLSLEEIVNAVKVLPHTRFVMRDCKILTDPRETPVTYDGTVRFHYSLRSKILAARRDETTTNYYREAFIYRNNNIRLKLAEKLQERLPPVYKQNKDVIRSFNATEVIADFSDETKEPETIVSELRPNKVSIRALFCFPVEIEGIIQLKRDLNRQNTGLDQEKSKSYGLYVNWGYDPDGKHPNGVFRKTHSNYLGQGSLDFIPIFTKEDIDNHNLNKINLQQERVKVLEETPGEFNIDAVDLHDRFYTDEERETLPLFDHRQWQEIRVGKIKLPEEVTAIRIRTSAIIQESLFLDANDWTLSTDYVLANRERLMFNCLCYQNATVLKEEGLTGGEISLFRNFMIYE